MTSRIAILAWLTVAAFASAQDANPRLSSSEGTYLGVLFGPISEALLEHLPQLPRKQGVIVTHVLPDSPAEVAKVRRHDLILEYAAHKIHDCADLARLIQADQPGHKVRLGLLREGKVTSVEVTLGRGPALKIAPVQRGQDREEAVQKAVAKGNGPAPVSVSAVPLENGRLRVTVEYYHEASGRLRSLSCEGGTQEIDGEMLKLPERERNLARVALQRIRTLNSPRSQEAAKTRP